MAIKKSGLTFTGAVKTVITYDLSDNDVSAGTIAAQSNTLYTTITVGGTSYNLPNTTLCSTLTTKDDAEAEFRSAFAQTGSKAKITRLFVIEVFEKRGYIENNE